MVVLPKRLYQQIQHHAERAYPSECCGLLLGETKGQCKSVRRIMETENDAVEMKHKRYCIPPKALLAAENLVREKGWDVLGVYHSHPDHPPRPSEFDRKRAILYFEYIIVGVSKGRVTETGCWIMKKEESEFESEELLISNQGSDQRFMNTNGILQIEVLDRDDSFLR